MNKQTLILMVAIFVVGLILGLTIGYLMWNVVCNKPYIRVGKSCCLDRNNDNICDKDKPIIPTTTTTTTSLPPTTVFVLKVLDGDTIEVQIDGKVESVRLIGINTPEVGRYYFTKSTDKLKELVYRKTVTLEKDITDKDMYGRLLRYVWFDDMLVNLEMVKEGYAHVYFYEEDIKYANQLLNAENDAKASEIGIWKSSINPNAKCITLSSFNYDAKGNDNYNLNDEYVTFMNNCDHLVDISGWAVKDEATHIYDFPRLELPAHATITLHTGSGTNTVSNVYWNSDMAIWNNIRDNKGGDRLFLRDSSGGLVIDYNYKIYT